MRWKLAAAVWLLCFSLLLVSAGRSPIWGDAGLTSIAASSLLDHGRPDLPPGIRVDVFQGRDGRSYSKYPWVPILLSVPPVLSEYLLKGVNSDGLHYLTAAVLPAALGASVAAGLVAVAALLGASLPWAVGIALLTLFSTPLWFYSRIFYSEAAQAAFLVWLFFASLKAGSSEKMKGWLFLAGILSGLILNAKLPLMVFTLAFAIWFLRPLKGRKLADLLIWGGAGFAPGLAAYLWLNAVRYGSFFSAGYSAERDGSIGLSSPVWPGLYGLLFSSGKSIFLYAPLLLAAFVRFPTMFRGAKGLALALLIPSGLYTVVIAKWWAWSGDWAWGPRLLVPLIPLLLIPLLRDGEGSRPLRKAVLLLGGIGICVQLLGILVPETFFMERVWGLMDHTYYSTSPPYTVRDDLLFPHFVPEFSPPVVHLWLLRGLFMNPESWLASYPWRDLHVEAFKPSMIWKLPYVNVWWDGSLSSSVALLALCTLAALFSWRIVRRLRGGDASKRSGGIG